MIIHPLQRTTPEAVGISPRAILAFVDEAEATLDELHSFMLLRHGKVAAEGWWKPYAPHLPHMLFSLSKSFTSTAIGLAIAEGHLSIDDPVLKFFPEEAPPSPSENLKAMRLRQLLSMSTGHQEDTTGRMVSAEDGNWVRAFLSLPVEHKPGTHFVYNSGATYMLSAVIQKVTGTTLLEYLKPRLFEPLGIENPTWETCPHGIHVGGWGLSIRTEDIARFGQLLLQKGLWEGKQIVPEAWVEEATSRQVSNGSNPESDWEQGYGYQFWRCRHGAYRGDGAFGQFCLVMPSQDAVLAITAGVGDMQAVLNLVWKHLYGAMQPASLPEDPSVHQTLTQRLISLARPLPTGITPPALSSSVTGRRYLFPENEMKLNAATFEFTDHGTTLTLEMAGNTQQVLCGAGEWVEGTMSFLQPQPAPVMAAGAWTSADTYRAVLRFHTSPFYLTLTARWSDAGTTLHWNACMNVSFGPTQFPELVGKAQPI